jgi:hypothetical protein
MAFFYHPAMAGAGVLVDHENNNEQTWFEPLLMAESVRALSGTLGASGRPVYVSLASAGTARANGTASAARANGAASAARSKRFIPGGVP